MNKKLMKPFAFLFSFLLIFANLTFVQPTETFAKTLDNAVTISVLDADGGDIVGMKAVEFEEGDTALDVLEEVAEVETEDSDWGPMIVGINNIIATYDENNHFWAFYVNDEEASVGADSYLVKNKDKILFTKKEIEPYEPEENTSDKEDNSSKDEEDVNQNQENKSDKESKDSSSDENETNNGQETEENKDINDVDKTDEENNSTEKPESSIEDINQRVKEDLAILKEEIEKRGLLSAYGREAYVWAYAKAGGEVPTAYFDDIVSQLEKDDNFTKTTNEIAKVVIALSAGGFDASEVGNTDLIEKLLEKDIPAQGSISTQAYALHAFDSGNYEVSETVKEEIVTSIIDKQMTSGGWGFFGNTPSPDATGMVLNALAPYKANDVVKVAVEKAVDYLADGFDETGWYHDRWSGGYTSEAISQVIVGLTALDIDPTEAPFVDDDGKALLSYLLEFKADDGLYKHVANGNSDLGFATSQAFLALAYYQNFVTGVSEEEIPEEPEVKERPVKLDEEVEVKAGEKLKIEETNSTLVIPRSVKDNTTIKIQDVTKEEATEETLPKNNQLRIAGKILSITIDDVTVTKDDPFILTLPIDKTVNLATEDVDVYYYDEAKKEWIKQNGELNENERTITIKPTHFSTYGVLATTKEVNKEALEENINEAKQLELDNKTEESKQEFEKALEEAQRVLSDEKASQTEVDDARKALEKAISNLTDRGPPTSTTKTVDVRVEGLEKTLLPTTEVEVDVFDINPYVTSGNAPQYDDVRAVHAIIEGLKSIDGFDPKDDQQFGLGSNGGYITKIGKDAESSSGNLSGWMYHVNNESAPVGVADFKIEDGDSIVVYFVENYLDSTLTWFDKDNYKVQVSESLSVQLKGSTYEGDASTEGSYLLIDGKPYEVDGEKVLVDKDGNITVTFDKPGKYELSAERFNDEGQRNIVRPAATVEVVVDPVEPEEDTTAPKITVSGVKDGQKSLTNKLEFTVKAIDDVDGAVTPTVTFNGETIKATNSDAYAVTLKEGENKIVVEAKDAANNIARKEITVIYEKPSLDASTAKALDSLIAYVLKTGVNSEWLAVGLQQSGEKVPASYEAVFKENVQKQVVEALENNRMSITDVERLVLAALAINKDPRNIEGTNLVELIYNSPERELYDGSVVDTLTYQGNNGIAHALIALDAGKFDIPKDAKWTREKLVDTLLSAQREDGAWNLNDAYPGASIDITAMALTALAPYMKDENVALAIDQALAYLSDIQREDGGFDGGANVGGVTSEAASQVIIALAAIGIDPKEDERFTKELSLIDHLLSYQLANGGFKHTLGESKANNMATEQALLALAAYKKFVEQDSPLYNFDTSTLEKVEAEEVEKEKDNEQNEEDLSTEKDDESNGDESSNNSDVSVDKDDSSNNKKDDNEVESKTENDEQEKEAGDKLPDTATTIFNFFFIGFLLTVIGLWMVYIKRRIVS